jgi:hypothetical protein
LYNNGLVYGTDDNGALPAGSTATPRNQKKQVTKNNRTYWVRLPKGSAAPTTELLTDLTAADGRWTDGEWNRTMGRMGCNTLTLCSRSRLGNRTPNITTTSNTCSIALTQHFRNLNGNVIVFFYAASDVPTYVAYTSNGYYWRPVLELVL